MSQGSPQESIPEAGTPVGTALKIAEQMRAFMAGTINEKSDDPTAVQRAHLLALQKIQQQYKTLEPADKAQILHDLWQYFLAVETGRQPGCSLQELHHAIVRDRENSGFHVDLMEYGMKQREAAQKNMTLTASISE